jgi:hypothetical protein
MQIFRYGTYDDHFDIIPSVAIYLHKDFNGTVNFIWHFHISIQWIKWYFEIQIGKDYKEE